jgi:hypothetical protein
MKLAQTDERKLAMLLDELARAVEDLLLTGLTTASEATRQKLHVAFQEASRLRLLRLGSTLRVANDELGRFTRNEAEFSRQRLLFFLNRAWMLSHGLTRALKAKNEREFDRLLGSAATTPAPRLEVVTLGVVKKITSAFVAFEFRLRVVTGSAAVNPGQRLAWSCIFPTKPGATIPAEGYLHLPQKQKFNASIFLEGKTLVIERASISLDEFGGGRLALDDGSTVATGKEFAGWEPFLTWDPAAALRRIRATEPGPFDLDVELQEEVVFRDWEMGEAEERHEERHTAFPIHVGPALFDARVGPGAEGQALRKALDDLRKKKKRPPLFGLLHYEKCRLVLQPLSVFDGKGPQYLPIAADKIDRAALLKALKF